MRSRPQHPNNSVPYLVLVERVGTVVMTVARGELPGPRELSKKPLAGHTGFSKVVMQGKTGHRVGGDICNTYC